jgi:cytoskeletal protein RodZ
MSRLRVAVFLLMPSVAVVLLFGALLFWRASAIGAAAKGDTKAAPAAKAATDTKKTDKAATEPPKEAPKTEPKQDAAKPDTEKKADASNPSAEAIVGPGKSTSSKAVESFEKYQRGAAQSEGDPFGRPGKSDTEAQDSDMDTTLSTGKLRLHGPSLLEK